MSKSGKTYIPLTSWLHQYFHPTQLQLTENITFSMQELSTNVLRVDPTEAKTFLLITVVMSDSLFNTQSQFWSPVIYSAGSHHRNPCMICSKFSNNCQIQHSVLLFSIGFVVIFSFYLFMGFRCCCCCSLDL